ncbi:MAG: glycosyltransferase [Nitrosopumilus sp.]|nr:glycosyltransferase [Nitrosopumilus sp.]
MFHNFMDNIGGAEMVTLTLARELKADIYTTNIDSQKIEQMGFVDVIPRIISLGKIPKNAPFRHQLTLWKFRRLNLEKRYDFYIISGDWAMSGVVNNKPNLWYVHSPLNELWEFKNYIRSEWLPWWKRPLFDIWVMVNRHLTLRYANYVENWVCNSINSKKRIKKYYKKEAQVIYPPIYTKNYAYRSHKNYWLSVNRLTPHKRIDIQMQAFSKIPHENLIIVGSYEKGANQFEETKKYIEGIKPNNVNILSWVSDEKLKMLYAECKGLITTSKDEDFGMTAVEAMASGKPVIAPDEGGYRESVIHNETGILIDSIDTQKLTEAIKHLSLHVGDNPDYHRKECEAQAQKYDTATFISKIKELIEKK